MLINSKSFPVHFLNLKLEVTSYLKYGAEGGGGGGIISF